MTRRLTFLDLRLDQHLYRQHFLASRAYRAFRSDFDLADPSRCPAIAFPDAPEEGYKPPEIRPQVPLTDLEQRRMWRQGLYSGQVSQAVDALMLTDGTDGAGRARYRVMTYAEFAKALGANDLRTPDAGEGGGGEMKTALRPISDLFLDFHPARRPVTWRILMAQTACYRALIAAARDPDLETSKILRQALFARSEDRADFDWLGDGTRAIPPALRHGTDFAAERDLSAERRRFLSQDRYRGFGSPLRRALNRAAAGVSPATPANANERPRECRRRSPRRSRHPPSRRPGRAGGRPIRPGRAWPRR